ncbi:nucleotide disphospho-sugar-binding domain-containing protein [Streptomyces pseudovenezuelae]|uniref:UDP:flavonoid glycosyltransferase YjiC (YdhE family) n=1 Tax=Streptomyces pseudovenezuelae TaxID=67350 RepID=A0ABT6LA26_9ACTN|nr:nucleotide disphospho-sugar-binding domain-containing protein [Streptomyces pseudovenezuelae]MDH6213170.1 UDP:flavonoid glycosyltransferase YjiC (YdhE family) [Streptomyces pseudovenezuelae]
MRVLFTVSSWPTQYAAMVPLGWAFQAAGHEVRVLCAPSQSAAVGRAGLVPVPVLAGMEEVLRLRLQYHAEAVTGVWPYPWLPPHPLTGERIERLDAFDAGHFDTVIAPELAESAARSFDAAVAHAREWQPDLVLHDPGSLEGLLAAKVLKIPSALCLWGPASPHDPEHMRIVPTDHSGSFTRYGLGTFDLTMIERVVDPNPPSLKVPVEAERLPVRYVPYNGGGPAPAWTARPPEGPRVVVTWSTALSTVSGPDSYLLPRIVAALDGLDCEVVLTATARDVAALGAVPARVRVAEHLPLAAVLPGCAAVVHHGGSGSSLTAMWAGVPQFIATFASEQQITGERVAATGAALHVPGHLADETAIRAGVERLLDDSTHTSSAARLRTEIAETPTPAALVDRLEALATAD